jgi:hypothetical protein
MRISSDVFVPGKGWFIFGGDGNTIPQSQMLQSINSTWTLGPQLYQSTSVYGQCNVQVFLLNLTEFYNFNKVANYETYRDSFTYFIKQ